MKFPEIDPTTLDSKHPVLEAPEQGNLIDYYGPCDESPTGKDQVWQQKLDEERHWRDKQHGDQILIFEIKERHSGPEIAIDRRRV